MEELEVTQLWMGGVVLMMLVFGVLAAVGYKLSKSRDD